MVSHHSSWQLHLSAASSPETRTAGRCGFQGMKKNSTGQGSFFLPVNLCPGLSLSREFGHPGVLRGAGQRQSPPPPFPPPACDVPEMFSGGSGDSKIPC